MKALVIHAPKDLRLEAYTAAEGPDLKPGEVRIRTAAGGVCGSDLHYYHHGGFGTVRLRDRIAAAGGTCYLEVVSEDRESELASAAAARRIGVDVLLGGTRADEVTPVLAGSGIRYMPFPGRVEGLAAVATALVVARG